MKYAFVSVSNCVVCWEACMFTSVCVFNDSVSVIMYVIVMGSVSTIFGIFLGVSARLICVRYACDIINIMVVVRVARDFVNITVGVCPVLGVVELCYVFVLRIVRE